MWKTLRRTFVSGIILLIISATFTPSISVKAVTASDDNTLITLTTQIWSSKGETCHAFKVTNQQAREIQRVFNDLKNQLSTADSLEETHSIFNDTIDALARYPLLPHDIPLHHLKRLATSASYYQKAATLLQQRNTKSSSILNEGEIQNFFCSVAGNTSTTHVAKLAKRIALRLYVIMDHHTGNALLVKVATALWIVFNQISKITQKIVTQNGTHYGVSMYFGNYHYYPYPDWLHPAEGWISTNGINGKQNISGSFWGQTITGGWQPQDDWYVNYTWRGCLGFTGLITYVGPDNAYYLGSALQVHVGPNRPRQL